MSDDDLPEHLRSMEAFIAYNRRVAQAREQARVDRGERSVYDQVADINAAAADTEDEDENEYVFYDESDYVPRETPGTAEAEWEALLGDEMDAKVDALNRLEEIELEREGNAARAAALADEAKRHTRNVATAWVIATVIFLIWLANTHDSPTADDYPTCVYTGPGGLVCD